MEIWKDIEGYDNYMVSNQGRVKSLNYKHTGKEQVLKPIKHNKGYLMVRIYKNGKSKNFKVHRLVAQAFIPNTENKSFIDHINTDRTDNSVDNIRWVTLKENNNNPLTKEKQVGKIGKLNPNHKPILQFDKNMNFIRKWECAYDVQRELGFKQSNISNCCNGKRKTSYGYLWKHYNFELYIESKLFKTFNIST